MSEGQEGGLAKTQDQNRPGLQVQPEVVPKAMG